MEIHTYNLKTLLEIYFIKIHFWHFIKHLFTIKYEFLYKISLNTWVLLMVFNEILISQDSFTETNVTRKRSIVENSWLHSKIVLFETLHLITCFYMLEIVGMNDMLENCIKILNRTSSNIIPKFENKQLTCSNFSIFFCEFQ